MQSQWVMDGAVAERRACVRLCVFVLGCGVRAPCVVMILRGSEMLARPAALSLIPRKAVADDVPVRARGDKFQP